MTIVYDGDGNRVEKTAAGVTTSYLVDTNNLTGYAQVVEEVQNGSVSRSYSYGLSRISESQIVNGNWSTSFYGYDGHGSVRQLTNFSGAVSGTYDYDAFGNLIASTGTTPNNFLFAGEQFDSALGLYYNRARYLDVGNGRFWGIDTWQGDPEDPITLNKYAYDALNPVDKLDPTGNVTLQEQEEVAFDSAAIDATLQGILNATRITQTVRIVRSITLGLTLLAVALETSDGTQPTTTVERDNDTSIGPQPRDKKRRILYRLGKDWESAETLETQSEKALELLSIHGVSVLTKLPPSYIANTGWAYDDEVRTVFPVFKTGLNPFHYTVILPHPVDLPPAIRTPLNMIS